MDGLYGWLLSERFMMLASMAIVVSAWQLLVGLQILTQGDISNQNEPPVFYRLISLRTASVFPFSRWIPRPLRTLATGVQSTLRVYSEYSSVVWRVTWELRVSGVNCSCWRRSYGCWTDIVERCLCIHAARYLSLTLFLYLPVLFNISLLVLFHFRQLLMSFTT